MKDFVLLWQLAFVEIKQRPGRALFTLLSVVIGVAAVVAVYLASNTTHRAYEEMYQRLNGRAAFEIVGEGGGYFQQSLVDGIDKIHGVKAVVPSLQVTVSMSVEKKRISMRLLGIDPVLDAKVRDYELTDGRFFQQDYGVLIESEFARWAGIKVSDDLPFRSMHRGPQKVPVVGLLSARGVAGFNQGGMVFVSLKYAQWLIKQPGYVETISLVLDDAVDEAAVQKAILQQLPKSLTLRPTATRAQLGREVFANAERGLQFACALMIALAVFVVLNTFQMNLSERRTRLAILRAVGATRRQIMQLLLCETCLMGVLGGIFGCLLGFAGAHLLLLAMAQRLGSTPSPIQPTITPFLLAMVLGLGAAMLGTYIPTRRASRISPMEAIRIASPQEQNRTSRLTTIGGIALFTLSGLIVWACIQRWLPSVISIPAGATFLAAFALIIPSLVRPLGCFLVKMFSPIFHVEGYLAEQQLIHRSARAGLTAGVLYIAIAAGVGLGTTIINNVQDVRNWNERTTQGDFVVFAAFADQSGDSMEIRDALGEEIRQLPGVLGVDPVRYCNVAIGEDTAKLIARDYAKLEHLPLVLAEGQPEDVRHRLTEGEIVLGTVLAERHGLKVGDSVTMKTPNGPREFRVAGLTVDYTVGGNILCMERTMAEQVFHLTGSNFFIVRAEPKMLEEVQKSLKAICDREELMVYSFAEISQLLDSVMSGILSGLWGLLALGFIVAGFGIGNTLMMNVMEQTREIALLRVVGMTQRQVRRMILAQALIIGLVGLSLGVFAGVNTAYIMSLCMQPLLGYSVGFSLSPILILGSFGMALLIVLLAAWFPAGRAAKLDLRIALQYE